MNTQPKKKDDRKANPYYQAQDILSRRAHSEREVRQKMQRKGFADDQIQEVIDWLYTKRLLDDNQFCRTYIESITRTKHVGPLWIVHKLTAKGVDRDMAERITEEMVSAETQHVLIEQASEKWKRLHPKKAGDKHKLTRFLQSRGFEPQMVRQAIEGKE